MPPETGFIKLSESENARQPYILGNLKILPILAINTKKKRVVYLHMLFCTLFTCTFISSGLVTWDFSRWVIHIKILRSSVHPFETSTSSARILISISLTFLNVKNMQTVEPFFNACFSYIQAILQTNMRISLPALQNGYCHGIYYLKYFFFCFLFFSYGKQSYFLQAYRNCFLQCLQHFLWLQQCCWTATMYCVFSLILSQWRISSGGSHKPHASTVNTKQ